MLTQEHILVSALDFSSYETIPFYLFLFHYHQYILFIYSFNLFVYVYFYSMYLFFDLFIIFPLYVHKLMSS